MRPKAAEEEIKGVLAQCISLQLEGRHQEAQALIASHPRHAPILLRRLDRIRDLDPAIARPPDAEAGDPLLGRSLDDLEILSFLGKGASGRVYAARQKGLGRLVAVKVLAPAFSTDARLVERFRLEALALGKLNHPHIVQVHSVGSHPAHGSYLVMQFVRGIPLSDMIAFVRSRRMPVTSGPLMAQVRAEVKKREGAGFQAPLAMEEDSSVFQFAARLMHHAADALHSAHEQGLVHRDIKPPNILVTIDQKAVLVDFGLTQEADAQRMTIAGELLGTPLYLPPECLWSDSRAADGRSDIYSLGATFYEFLTGRPPFQGKSTRHTLKLIEDGRPSRPRDLNPDIPRDFETIILRCLRKNPTQRYPSAAHLAADLRAFLAGQPVRGTGRRSRVAAAGLTIAALAIGAVSWRASKTPPPATRASTESIETVLPPPLDRVEAPAAASPAKTAHQPRQKSPPAAPVAPPIVEAPILSPGPVPSPDPEAILVSRYTDPDRRFSFIPPVGWSSVEDRVLKAYGYRSPDNQGMFVVRILGNAARLSLSQAAQRIYEGSPYRIKILSSREHPMSGRPALRQEILAISKIGRERQIIVLVDDGPQIFVLTGYSLDKKFDDFRPLYEALLSSFEISDSPPVTTSINPSQK